MNRAAAELARRAADDFTRRNPDKPRFVAGSIGPTNKSLSLGVGDDPGRRDVTFDQMVDAYAEQIRALVDGGVDILLPETSFDTLVLKACLFAIDKYFDEIGRRLPVMVSGTIFDNGRTLSAQTVEAFYVSVSHFDALSVGLNCAVGVDLMRPEIETLAGDLPHAHQLLSQRRPARRLRRLQGRPRPHGRRPRRVRPQRLAQHRRRLLRHHARLDPRHRRGRQGRAAAQDPRSAGLVLLQRDRGAGRPARDQFRHDRRADQHHRLEALRPRSSRRATSRRRWRVAREQVEGGANIIDVNMDADLIDGEEAMTRFLNLVSAEPAIASSSRS